MEPLFVEVPAERQNIVNQGRNKFTVEASLLSEFGFEGQGVGCRRGVEGVG